MNEAVFHFVREVAMHFPIKHGSDEAERAWLESHSKVLSRFSPEVLRQAADKIVETRKYKTFPLPADIIEACEIVEKRAAIKHRAMTLPTLAPPTTDEWSPERQRIAYSVCRTALGRQAAREGWVLRLWNFARVELRHPGEQEVERLKREVKAHKQLIAQCHAGSAGHFSASLAKLGDGMLAKEDRLAGEVLGQ